MSSSSRPHLTVIGAGFLGRELCRGWSGPVTATTRRGEWAEGAQPPHVRVAALDVVTSDARAYALLRDASYVVVCLAAGRQQDRREVYVEGTRRILQGLSRRCARMVFISSTSALPNLDAWIDETCEVPPEDERGRVQCDAEDLVMSWAARHDVPAWVLRLGGLYGPGRDLGAIYRRRDDAPLPGHGHAPTNLIHREDAVAAILAALRADPSRHGRLHIVDDDKTPRRTMYDRLARARNLPPVRWSEPVPPGAAPHGKRICNQRMKSTLGLRLLHPTHSPVDPCEVPRSD